MNKIVSIFLLIACFSIQNEAMCQISTKGNWTTVDKFNTIAELNQQRAVFEAFLDSSQIDPLIQCIADELEQTYENPEAVDTGSDTIQAISVRCLTAVGFNPNATAKKSSSVKGNWSQEDLDAAAESLEITRGTMNELMQPDAVDLLFECILFKLEANYNNFDEALNDPNDGISGLTMDCLAEKHIFEEDTTSEESNMIKKEQGDPNSTYGKWSEEDKSALNNELEALRPKFESQFGIEKTNQIFQCVRFNFEHAFENYADINNHPEVYKGILNECNEMDH